MTCDKVGTGWGLLAQNRERERDDLHKGFCPSCGEEFDVPEEALRPGYVYVCDHCAWVQAWGDGDFRPCTALELALISEVLPVMIKIGQISLEKQSRVMGYAR